MPAMPRYVAYYRVSTARQGRSGLGLEAQQAAVQNYIGVQEMVGEFVEIESGRNSDRPRLAEAITLARRTKATLIIAKLDRLARNVAFIANLLESNIEFIAADMPTADRMVLQMMAVVAEHEARMISQRTKAALAAAKARGTQLGNRKNLVEAQANGHRVIVKQADDHAARIFPAIKDVVMGGLHSVHKVADALNSRGVATRRGGTWTGSSILAIIRRSGYAGIRALCEG